MAQKKSLSETFVELINPAPLSFDPEDDGHETVAKVVENEDNDSEEENLPSVLRKRKFDFLEEEDERYEGTKVSRKSLGMEENDSDSEGDFGDFTDGDGKSIGEDDLDESPDEGEKSDENDTSQDEYSENESSTQQEDKSEVNEESFQHISSRGAELERDKGVAVKNQLTLWDNLLQCRITLQKTLGAANQFPQFNTFHQFASRGGLKFKTEIENTKKSLSALLEKLIKFQTTMLNAYPETNMHEVENGTITEVSDEEITSDSEGEESSNNHNENGIGTSDEDCVGEDSTNMEDGSELKQEQTKERSLVEYSKLLDEQHIKHKKFWNATIQKWNDKTRVSDGKLSNRNFSSFEQSTLKQIEQVLSNRQRLIQRTQLKRMSYNILGQDSQKVDEEKIFNETDDIKDSKKDSIQNGDYNGEIFDDTDFYHQLLRELIERKSSGVTDSTQIGKQWLQLQKLRSKMKRKLDTRATKGRKIRYAVHSKLVNFMAPEDKHLISEEAKSELFNSLFGNKTKLTRI